MPDLRDLIGQRFSMLHPHLADQDGRGVRVVVVDSGVHAEHAHIGGVAGGIALHPNGTTSADYADRLGHGTAVTAVIRERALAASLYAARVFDESLATTAEALARGVAWAVDQEADIVNLSLGTANLEREETFSPVLELARERNVWVVSAAEHDGQRWLPGSMPGSVGVVVDWECERTAINIVAGEEETVLFSASGYPRPVPGLPPERNLRGVSFAVANVSAFLTLVRQAKPGMALDAALGELAGVTG